MDFEDNIKEITTRTSQGWFGMQTTLQIGIDNSNQSSI